MVTAQAGPPPGCILLLQPALAAAQHLSGRAATPGRGRAGVAGPRHAGDPAGNHGQGSGDRGFCGSMTAAAASSLSGAEPGEIPSPLLEQNQTAFDRAYRHASDTAAAEWNPGRAARHPGENLYPSGPTAEAVSLFHLVR